MRTLASFVLLASAALAAAPLHAAPARPATTQIVQQRLSDGSILFTDNPVPGAATERTWRVPAEDPVEARRRAAAISAEAQAVSERIQRLLEQQRRDEAEHERVRMARAEVEHRRERELAAAEADRAWTDGVVLFAPQRWPAPRKIGSRHHGHRHASHGDRRHGVPARMHRPKGTPRPEPR